MGISPFVAGERLFLDHLKSTRGRASIPGPQSDALVAAVVEFISRYAGGDTDLAEVQIVDLLRHRSTRHSVLEHPWCPDCRRDHAARHPPRFRWAETATGQAPRLALPEVLDRLASLIDSRFRLIADVQAETAPGPAGVVTAVARFALPHSDDVAGSNWNVCGGGGGIPGGGVGESMHRSG